MVSLNDDSAPWSLTFADGAYANADSNGDDIADGTITVSAAIALTNGVTVVAGEGRLASANSVEVPIVSAAPAAGGLFKGVPGGVVGHGL